MAKGDEAAIVESVKAASEIYAPVAGEVIAVNGALADAPGTVNTHPEGAGWFLKLKVANKVDFDTLMDGEAYAAFVETVED
jgi:glycine cleavage system H protein